MGAEMVRIDLHPISLICTRISLPSNVDGADFKTVAWRVPLGQSGILDLFLEILAEDGLSQGLKVHSLRLIGNSCADTDENRGRLVADNRLNSVIRQLSDDSLIPFTIPVLYNIMVDYGKL